MSQVPIGSQFTTDTGVPTYVPTPARLLAVSYNVAKSVGVENDAVTTTVEGAFITTVYSVSGTSARRLLERLVVQQEEAEQEEPQRLEQAKQHLQQALVQPQDPQDLQQQQQARSRALLQTDSPPPPRVCLTCARAVESALAAGLCISLKLNNCSILTVSCLNESVIAVAAFPAVPTDAAQAALANSCDAALLATFAMPNTTSAQQAAMTQALLSTPIIAPGYGVVPPPASTSSVAPSALLRTVVVNTGKPNPGSNSSEASFSISGAMVAESVAATFGLPQGQVRVMRMISVVLVTDPSSRPSGGQTVPAPAPGSIPTPNLGPDGSPSPPSNAACTENPKFGSLCGAAAVGAIPVSPMYGDRSTMPYSTAAWPPAPGPTTVAAVPGPWSALGPGASLGAAAARSAGGAAPGAPSAPWHDRDVGVGAAAAAAAAAAGAVLTKSPGASARAGKYYSGGGVAPRWSSAGGSAAGGAYGTSGGGGNGAYGSFLDINQAPPPPPGMMLGGNPMFYDLAGNPIPAPGVDSNMAAAAMAAAAPGGYGGGGSAGGAGGSPSRLRPPALIIPPQGAGAYTEGLNTLGSLASPVPASAGPAYGYRLGTGVGSPGVYSKYPGRGPQSLAAAAASPASVAMAARYSNRAAGYSNDPAAMAALRSSMAAESAAAEEIRRSRGAATMAGLASAAYSSSPYVGRTGAPPAASSLGGAGGEPLPRFYPQPQQVARPSPLGADAAPVRGPHESPRGSYGQPAHYGVGGLGSPSGMYLPGAYGKTGPAGPLPSPGAGRPASSMLGAGGVAVPMGLYGEPAVQQAYSPSAPDAQQYFQSPGGATGPYPQSGLGPY
eukprot:XP_001700153.1 predicted protein [Chlamydomonas reinhardtii]